MAVTLPLVGSQNWGDTLNAAINSLAAPKPLGALKQTVAQNVTSGVSAQITFNSVIANSAGMADLPNNRLLCPVTGLYTIYGQVAYVQGANGTYRRASLRVATTEVNYGAREESQVTNLATVPQVLWTGPCNAGDAITLYTYQNHGTTLATSISPYFCYLSAWLIQAT